MIGAILIVVSIVVIMLSIKYHKFIKVLMKKIITIQRKVRNTDAINIPTDSETSPNEDLIKEMIYYLKIISTKLKEISAKNEQISNAQQNENAEIKSLCYKMQTIESKLQVLSILPQIKDIVSTNHNSPQKTIIQMPHNEQVDAGQKMYARGIDSINPTGFRTTSLSNKFSGQFFQIERFSPDSATLTIVDTPSVKASMLPAMYQMVANGICEVENEGVSTPTDIIVIADGKVRLSNGLWEITDKIIVKLV